ncbi:hypothetical protein ASZ90_009499 [hydrocarbon metagenome]|uniref:Uncharacterized protein n=1 Tax=hydrocarbon metagenome TaxID=938273 RepID=A0A0W8FKC1_9ZZZZ
MRPASRHRPITAVMRAGRRRGRAGSGFHTIQDLLYKEEHNNIGAADVIRRETAPVSEIMQI